MADLGKLVFASGKSGDYDIFTLDLDDGAVQQLTTGEAWNDQPRWSPDGRSILFVSNRDQMIPKIFRMDDNGSDLTCLTAQNKYHSSPCFHPDGKSIIFCANYDDREEIDICRMSLEGSSEPEVLFQSPGRETEVCYSADGAHIVFASNRSGNRDIWRYSLSDQEFTQLTDNEGADYAPTYSPDGTMIAFVSARNGNGEEDKQSSDIWMMSSDGRGEATRLTKGNASDRYVRWSPDGRYLVYCTYLARGGSARLSVIDLEQNKVAKLDYDRSKLEYEIGAVVPEKGVLTTLLPDFIQRKLMDSRYFGSERFPDWKK